MVDNTLRALQTEEHWIIRFIERYLKTGQEREERNKM